MKHPSPQNSTITNFLLATLIALTLLSHAPAYAQNVIAWGNNSRGQTDVPPSATNVVSVAAGWYHSLALRSDGTVISWGSITNVPPTATNVTSIAAGAYHNLALREDGTIVAWGDNTYGQTDVPLSVTNVTAVAAGFYHSFALRDDGSVLLWGRGFTNITGILNNLALLTNVVAISAAAAQNMVLHVDGSVTLWGESLTWGWDPYSNPWWERPFQIYRSTKDIVAISAASQEQLALTAEGQIATLSSSRWARTIVPPTCSNVVLIAAGTNYHLAVRADGQVLAWGRSALTNMPSSATNAIAIAAGAMHCLAVNGDGTAPRLLGPIGCRSQIGAGSRLPLSARVVGSQPLHYQWLADGKLIPDTDAAFPQIPAPLGSDNVNYQVVVSNPFGSITSAVPRVSVQAVNVWGDNRNGQTAFPAAVTSASAIAAGHFHALALNPDGSVIAWGKNRDGQATVPFSAMDVVAIAALSR